MSTRVPKPLALRLLWSSDAAAGGLARGATTLGQCALLVLGVHLAADNLDDRVLQLSTWGLSWVDRELPLPVVAGWTALGVEGLAVLLLCGAFLLSERAPVLSWRRWRAALSVRALVLPLTMAGVLLAGAWSMAMGVEDLLPASPLAPWSAALVGLVTLLRFGVPAWLRTVAAMDPARRLTDGLASSLVLAPVGLLAWVYGLPLWGLLP